MQPTEKHGWGSWWLANHIDGRIESDDVHLGVGVTVGHGTVIKAKRVVLGDFCTIGPDVRVDLPEFRCGDYTKLHRGCFLHGHKPLQIGRNCWVGEGTILDSIGGLCIDDNVGIGAHSQVWSHVQHGDIVEGCRFRSSHPVYIGRDAWLVGHCIANMRHMAERSMALAGSVVTHDTLANHVYAGVPAVDVTAKVGPQFEERTVDEKMRALSALITNFRNQHPQWRDELGLILGDPGQTESSETTWFDVVRRTYIQTRSEAEVTFLRENPLLRVTPAGAPPFVDRGLLEA